MFLGRDFILRPGGRMRGRNNYTRGERAGQRGAINSKADTTQTWLLGCPVPMATDHVGAHACHGPRPALREHASYWLLGPT